MVERLIGDGPTHPEKGVSSELDKMMRYAVIALDERRSARTEGSSTESILDGLEHLKSEPVVVEE